MLIVPRRNVASSSGTPWTPALISKELWLDSRDGATLFAANTGSTLATVGGAVGRWEDKSDKARHVSQATSANRPTLVSTGVNFTAATMVLTGTVINSTTLSIYAVVQEPTGQSPKPVYNGDDSANGFGFWNNQASNGKYTILFGGVNVSASTLSQSQGSNAIVALRRSATAIAIGKNGTAGTVTQRTPVTPTGTIKIGANVSGIIREVIVTSSYVADSVDQQIVGYLAWGWNLVSDLPANHPFKTAAPTV